MAIFKNLLILGDRAAEAFIVNVTVWTHHI